MEVRVASAIATLQVPDILLIDEALTVGDERFKEKSPACVREILTGGGAIIMDTHNLDEVRTSGTCAMRMDESIIRADGDDVLALHSAR